MKKTFVQFAYPGIFMSETSEMKISKRDPKLVKIPKGCYAFRFYDQTVVMDGKETLTGKAKNYSGWHYIKKSRVMTLTEVKKEFPHEKILIDNMEINKYKKIVKTPQGNTFPLEKDDVLL